MRVCVTCTKNRSVAKFFTPRGTVCSICRKATARRNARKAHLAKTYGITPEEYDALGDVCHVCGGKRPYNLHVDHDHALEQAYVDLGVPKPLATRYSIRGLACKRDNKLLRDLRDNAVLIQQLLDYLSDPPARRILEPVLTQLSQLVEMSAE